MYDTLDYSEDQNEKILSMSYVREDSSVTKRSLQTKGKLKPTSFSFLVMQSNPFRVSSNNRQVVLPEYFVLPRS